MKNILIMGVGRAGKTTLAKMIKRRLNVYSVIHSDGIKWGVIRGEGKEDYYRSNLKAQASFERSNFFQTLLLETFKFSTSKGVYVMESGQLEPKVVAHKVNLDNTVVICLGHGNLSEREIMRLCIEHDKREDWSYGLSEDKLLSHAQYWHTFNQYLKEQCNEHGIKYVDTSINRLEVLETTTDYLCKEAKGGNIHVE